MFLFKDLPTAPVTPVSGVVPSLYATLTGRVGWVSISVALLRSDSMTVTRMFSALEVEAIAFAQATGLSRVQSRGTSAELHFPLGYL